MVGGMRQMRWERWKIHSSSVAPVANLTGSKTEEHMQTDLCIRIKHQQMVSVTFDKEQYSISVVSLSTVFSDLD